MPARSLLNIYLIAAVLVGATLGVALSYEPPPDALVLRPPPARSHQAFRIVGQVEGAEPGMRVDAYVYEPENAYLKWRLPHPLPEGPPARSAPVGADGRYELAGLSSDVYQVRFVAPNGRTHVSTVYPGMIDALRSSSTGGWRVDVRPGTGVIAGRAVYADGRPFEGWVCLVSLHEVSPPWIAEGPLPVHTDDKGRFRFEHLRDEPRAILAVAPGRRASLLLEPPESLDLIRLVVDQDARPIRGHVQDDQGKPVAGAAVVLTNGFGPSIDVIHTRSGPDGSFEGAVRGPNLIVNVRAPGHVTTQKSMREVDESLVVRVARKARVYGRVRTVEGKPVADVPIYAVAVARGDEPESPDPPTMSDAQGRYTVEVRPGGSCVAAFGNGWIARGMHEVKQPYPYLLETKPGETKEHDLIVVPSARVQGTVRDKAGSPLEGILVQARRPHPEDMQPWVIERDSVLTDAAGRFALTSVFPMERCWVGVDASTHTPSTSEPFDSVPGVTKNLEFHIVAKRQVLVTVTDQAGVPLSGVTIRLLRRQGGWGGVPAGDTGPDGTLLVRLSGHSTEYALAIVPGATVMGDGPGERTPIAEGTTKVTLIAARGRAITGRVLWKKQPVRFATIKLTAPGLIKYVTGRNDGTFLFNGVTLEPCTVESRMEVEGVTWSAKADVAAGATDPVDLNLQPK